MREDELMHYGVLGMKWGVRKANRSLARAITNTQRNKALNRLESHRAKSVKKVSKLDNRITKLERKSNRDAEKKSYKAATLARRAAKLNKKSHSIIRIKSLDGIRNWRSARLDNKAESMRKNIEKTKSRIVKNKKMRDVFNTSISNIDRTLIENGRKILENS